MEKAVDFTRLEKNIIEVIQEEQIKLGYRSELIRLYYPITSLNRFFHTNEVTVDTSSSQNIDNGQSFNFFKTVC